MLKLFKCFHVKYFANNTKSKVYMQCNHFSANCFSATRGIVPGSQIYIPLMLILTFKYILISISLDFLVQFPGGFSLLLILLADNCFCTHALSLVRDLLVVPLPLAHPHSPLPAAAHRLRRPSRGSASARRGRQQPGSVFSVNLRVCVPRALGSSSGQPRDG